MTSTAPRITVSPARRYRAEAGRYWPVEVRPAPGELLSSWLHRVAHANGVPPRYFGAVLGAAGGAWSAQLDRHLPEAVRRILLDHTSICPEELDGLCLANSPALDPALAAADPAARCRDIDGAVLLAAVLSLLPAGRRGALFPAELDLGNPRVLLSPWLPIARPLPVLRAGPCAISSGSPRATAVLRLLRRPSRETDRPGKPGRPAPRAADRRSAAP
jgi:hypothetical protein